MIRRAIDWLRAEIATPTVGQLADRLELAEGAAARDAAQIAALTDRLRESEAARFALLEQLAEACRERDKAREIHRDSLASLRIMMPALQEIAAQETPGANGTVKRMARIAREALE